MCQTGFGMFFFASSFSTVVSSSFVAIDTHCTLSGGKHNDNSSSGGWGRKEEKKKRRDQGMPGYHPRFLSSHAVFF